MFFNKDNKNSVEQDLVGVYVLHDSKSEVFTPPMFIKNRGLAERAMLEGLSDPNASMTKYPADFTLFEIGQYDDKTATMFQHEAKVNLGTALEFMQKLKRIQQQKEETQQ